MTPFAVTFESFAQLDFWISVGIVAGTYGIFTLGLQLNAGFTGIVNFGQAGFMAIGAYAMGILVVKAGWSFWLAIIAATVIAIGFGLLIGLPSLRLRADYFAIVTIAASEVIRYIAQNWRELTEGNQGILGFDTEWLDLSFQWQDALAGVGLGDESLLPLLLVTWILFLVLMGLLMVLQRTPWGRVLRAIREDEDAARALGKNTFAYKLASLSIAAALGAMAGYILALNLAYLNPEEFEPIYTFLGYAALVLGGLASYPGVAVGTVLLIFVYEGTRFIELPLAADKVDALRFVVIGLVLVLVMRFRPQGILGKREEMVLGE